MPVRGGDHISSSIYLHLAYNVSDLMYHSVCLAEYRRLVIRDSVDESLRQICEGRSSSWKQERTRMMYIS